MSRKAKLFFSFFCILFVFVSAVIAAEGTVWIATSGKGKRFHYQSCRTLTGGKKEISVEEARELGYTGCAVCGR